jgi:hypothetical protein
VATTEHVVIAVALSDVLVKTQPVPVTAKVTAPVPEPPEVVSEMAVPTTDVVDLLEIMSLDWFTPVKVKTTAADFASANAPAAALVATTLQVPGCVAVNVVVLTTQPVPVAAKVTAPVPEPPEVVNLKEDVTEAVVTELVMKRGACGAAALALGTNVKATKDIAPAIEAAIFLRFRAKNSLPIKIDAATSAIVERTMMLVMYSPY